MAETQMVNPTTAALDRKTLVALMNASQAINADLETREVFRRIAQQAAAVLGAEGASVLLFDAERNELVFQTALGPAGAMLEGERIKADQGIAGQVARTGRAVRVDDARANRHFFDGIDAKTMTKTRGILAAPMLVRDQVLGVVEVLNPQDKQRFNDGDLELLKLFANLAATAACNAQAYDRVTRQNRALRAAIPTPTMVGQSKPMRQVQALCQRVAPTMATVLIRGQTGTGKELVARTIHDLSPRRDKPFIAVNCAALAESLVESELFGHEKGAFTGAADRKLGRFELADTGTLFLDELGEMSPQVQVKLLRLIQEHTFERVGGMQTITCDVRIVAATNRDLKADMESGRFRSDLYYRLSVFPIMLPPLHERIDDLPLLVDHFVRQIVPSLGVKPPAISDEAMSCLARYDWPGNIRELRNVIERAALLAGDSVTPHELPPEIVSAVARSGEPAPGSGAGAGAGAGSGSAASDAGGAAGGSKLAHHEVALIRNALESAGWNQSAAARALGISRDNLRYRIRKYGLKPSDGAS